MRNITTTRRTTVLTRREFDAVTSYCFHNATVAASDDLRDWPGAVNDLDERWTAEAVVRAIESALAHHGDCAGQRPELRRALRKALQVAAEVRAGEPEVPALVSPRRIILGAFGGWGWCSAATLVAAVVRECGLGTDQAHRAVYSFLASEPRVQVEGGGGLHGYLHGTTSYYSIPGLGGA
jgi:hypothetical protein